MAILHEESDVAFSKLPNTLSQRTSFFKSAAYAVTSSLVDNTCIKVAFSKQIICLVVPVCLSVLTQGPCDLFLFVYTLLY